MKARTALLVRCSEEEAEVIRDAAKHERRTISGYILNSVLHRIANQQKLEEALGGKRATESQAPGSRWVARLRRARNQQPSRN